MNKGLIKLRKEQLLANLYRLIGKKDLSFPAKEFNLMPVFLISTGRTGTNFFSHFFQNNFESCFSVHEPQEDTYDLNIAVAAGRLSYKQAGIMLARFRQGILSQAEKGQNRFYIESNNNLSFLIPVIQSLFSDYRIIHISRDGRDVVRSIYSRRARWNDGSEVAILSDDDPRERFNANLLKENAYFGKWDQMSRFERICWYWANKDAWILDEIEMDEKAISVKFEDLFKVKDINEWDRIIDFCNLRDQLLPGTNILDYIIKSKSNKTKSFILGKYENWPEEYKEIFHRHASHHMKRCGYNF